MSVADDLRIDPWSSQQSTDYARIRDEFGLGTMEGLDLPNPGMLHRRGIVFAQRDLGVVLDAARRKNPFGVLTGLMPSGRMHLGHSMVIEQVKWFQSQGADVTIAVADLEAHATRGMSLEKCRENALKEYVWNYAALGLDPDRTSVYFQSSRPIVQRLGFTLGKRTNLSEMESIYGFRGETNLAHVQAPMVQAGDILHPQLDEYGGLRPIVVPVGVDQDPHIRLTRDLAARTNWFNVKPRKSGGLSIGLSVQDENSAKLGVGDRGRIDRNVRGAIFDSIHSALEPLGFADVLSNPKHGLIELPGAASRDRGAVRMALLALERNLGGMGMLPPSSTYHRFAIGMTGDKMSSSRPETTIFLDDEISVMEKKVKRAFSGGQSTVEEHRRLGGDCDKDVAFQYLLTFFEPDDAALEEIRRSYTSGDMLAAEIKTICIDRATEWLGDIAEKRSAFEDRIDDFLAPDAL
ncbi:MAG: tryptophan--tRNA ligase [Candidatus Poseidoniales archaeon]|nr:MAG: tryptophan--tRNA ligase [Euryarchaeota archaeon TMED255]RAH10760.1 MAG: tryptophan--tRNA ligase [Euryarchaeota archaeon]RCH73299.1 MAG: tryptophan--tRNA ligase [Candidatus Poseidoniales archaeon]|tara:strand:- start:6554 stop:7942 length:1389 start_codon:yes stop_codon:yes gene_type:complete